MLVVYGIVSAISMIILGWPESTPGQIAMLELASLPLQASVGIGVWYLSRRIRPLGPRGRLVLWIAAGLGGIGLLLVGLAYLTGPRGMVQLGVALIWVGLLIALVLVVAHLPRRPARVGSLFSVLPEPEDDEEADDEVDEEIDPEASGLADDPGDEPRTAEAPATPAG